MSIIGALHEVRNVCVETEFLCVRGQDSYRVWKAYISNAFPYCGTFVEHIHLEKSSAQTHPGDSSYSHLGEKGLRNCGFFSYTFNNA